MRTIDADALFKAMEDTDWFNNADRDEIAERLVLDAPTVGGWISVKDRLPDEGQYIAVQHEVKNILYEEVGYYILGRWWLDNSCNGLELNAICWYPLPLPPVEVSEDADKGV